MPPEHRGDAPLRDSDADLLQFAHYSQVAPPWVLPRETADELDRVARQSGPAGVSVRIGPPSPHEAAMPIENCLRRDEERAPPVTRDEASEQGDQRSVGPVEAGPGHLPAQHPHLVPQHEDLGIPRKSVHSVDADERKGATGEVVEERQGHGQQHGRARRPWSNGGGQLLDPSPPATHALTRLFIRAPW